MQQIYRRTTMPKCDFNKVALQLYWNRSSARLVSCKFATYFQNTSGRLLLFLFLIYITDLPHDISSVCKMFANDTSLFKSKRFQPISLSDLNYDLEKINKWFHQWKMSVNPDPNKQATEVFLAM